MDLASNEKVKAAFRQLRTTDRQTLADMVEVVSIPAPPFGEAARGRWVAERLATAGLTVTTDEAGNVIAHNGHGDADSAIILSAHLDTIFPAETPINVQRNGTRISAPGIADNARGLAGLLAIARALQQEQIETEHPLLFIATVGEEGVGDLRGVKHLFRPGSPFRRARAFISLDGTGRRRVVYRAIGSRRLRAAITGAGGHSWADWGVANPVDALGSAIAMISAYEAPRQPRTSVTIGRIGGGTSVNAIPAEAWLEIDMRSEAGAVLSEVEAMVRHALDAAVAATSATRKRGTPPLQLDVRVIGDRPTGETPVNGPLVRTARAATRHFGDAPELVASSTDANIPIALGIPAIAIGAGGESGGTHTLDEWYGNQEGVEGIERALLIAVAMAGLKV